MRECALDLFPSRPAPQESLHIAHHAMRNENENGHAAKRKRILVLDAQCVMRIVQFRSARETIRGRPFSGKERGREKSGAQFPVREAVVRATRGIHFFEVPKRPKSSRKESLLSLASLEHFENLDSGFSEMLKLPEQAALGRAAAPRWRRSRPRRRA